MRYFIGNWKMFGVPNSINILKKINSFYSKDKNSNKYRVIVTPPYTLIQAYSAYFKGKKITIGAQNCYQKDGFSSDTAAVSPYMIKSVGAEYTLVGHSDNRSEGETDFMLRNKVSLALKNNLTVVYCIGESKSEKKNKRTFSVLKRQLKKVLDKKIKKNKIIVAYEPVLSIGSGKIPTSDDLKKTTLYIKKVLSGIFKGKSPAVLYGGSVNGENSALFKKIREIDGFLIGGASKSSKKFIDIIKNYYR